MDNRLREVEKWRVDGEEEDLIALGKERKTEEEALHHNIWRTRKSQFSKPICREQVVAFDAAMNLTNMYKY
jgi:hypothetical protein